MEVRHFRRPADRAGHDWRRRRRRPARRSSSARRSTCGRAASNSIWSCSTKFRRAIARTCRTICSGWPTRARRTRGSIGPAACFCAARTCMRRRRSRAPARRRARDSRRRPRRPRRAVAAAAAAVGAAAADQNEARGSRRRASPQRRNRAAGVLQRLRRIHRRWPRVPRDRAAAGAMVERHRERTLRLRRHRLGPRHHVVGEQLSQPADALEQRSHRRSAVRGRVPARRRERRVLDGNAVARRRGRKARHAVRSGLRHLRHIAIAGSTSSSPRSCPSDDPIKIAAAANPQHDAAAPRAERVLLRRLVPVRHPLALGGAHRDVDRHGLRRAVRAQCVSRRTSARRVAFIDTVAARADR